MAPLRVIPFPVAAHLTSTGEPIYYVDFDETKVNDAFMTATKDSDLLILNYGGFIPKMIVSATPNAGTAMEWKIEVCGVN